MSAGRPVRAPKEWMNVLFLVLVACRSTPAPQGQPLPVVVIAGGDVALGSRAAGDPLASLKELYSAATPRGAATVLRFANLESPITARGGEENLDADGIPTARFIRFGATGEKAAHLHGRLDIVSLANNHALDQGEDGRAATAAILASQGVNAVWEQHDQHLAVTWMARDLTSGPPDDAFLASIANAHQRGETVIVSLHWGTTGMLIPDEAQQRLAHGIIDAGAVAILGHGPHTLQGVELYRGGVIAYSLGNLFMDCRCTAETDALLLGLQLRQDGNLDHVWLLPFQAGVASQPPTLNDDAELLDLVTDLSRQLGTTLRREGRLLVAQ